VKIGNEETSETMAAQASGGMVKALRQSVFRGHFRAAGDESDA
jgi:hypothetical protein